MRIVPVIPQFMLFHNGFPRIGQPKTFPLLVSQFSGAIHVTNLQFVIAIGSLITRNKVLAPFCAWGVTL
jgi:hypothetical protein